jgi:uncharacterized protein (DUF362 family)
MEKLVNSFLRSKLFSRRDFLKYTGNAAGLYLAGRWLVQANPVLADNRPRVVSVRDSNATNWDRTGGYYWQSVDQNAVNGMVEKGVKILTGENNLVAAWGALIPYQSGEGVAIKVNFNNCSSCGQIDNDIDALAETVNTIIDGLLEIGVPPNKVWIADPSRAIPTVRFGNRINHSGVQFYSSKPFLDCGGDWYTTSYVDADSSYASSTTWPSGDVVRPAQVFVDAAHIINVPLLKGHGSGHMTLAMKNHYGSVTFSGTNQDSERSRMHAYLEPYSNTDHTKSILGDICNNPTLRDKHRLTIGDGLFGHPTINRQSVATWSIFDNDDPNILFFGTDIIATDSVMLDYIIEEQGRTVVHSSLEYGADLGLGVHDHWDSFATKQYSLIDYIHVDLDSNVDTVTRLDIDRKIRDFKEGNATEVEVKEIIRSYMEAN